MSKSPAPGKTVVCALSGRKIPITEAVRADALRPQVLATVRTEHPDISNSDYFAIDELVKYRRRYLEKLISEEAGELSQLESQVVEYIAKNSILAENIETAIDEKLSFGQRMADRIAGFGGSWLFIVMFFLFIAAWVTVNIVVYTRQAFDPYPFILLNLILSCVAAIQAPIIMMSQNRKEEKDRMRSEHDYKINLKAELEIRLLHEKMDHLMIHQNQRLLEIQEIQTEFLEDILANTRKNERP